MANQMIALQARNPQLPDSARVTAQYVNMMNMARQSEASQRQAQRLAQEMDLARAAEERAVQTHTATMREKDLDIEDKEMLRLYKIGAAVLETEDPTAREAAYQNLLGLIENTSPQLGATMRQVAGTFNAPVLQSVMMETEQYFNKKYPTPVASVGVNDRTGQTYSIIAGGTDPRAELIGEVPPRATSTTPRPAPAAAPNVPMRATQGVNTTPQDLINQGMNPNNIPSGMPTSRPISFNQSDMGGAGQMTPDVMSRIVDSAFQTGVMAQVDFDQLLASQPPQNKQALVDSFRRANITLQADAPSLADSAMGQQQSLAANPVQRPEAGFADLRGQRMPSRTANLGGDMPMMRNTEVQSQGRTPFIMRREAPLPGSAQVDPAILAAQEAAKAQAAANVNLNMAPKIAAANKQAERAVEKRSEALVAKNETKTLIQSIDKYINEIDDLLRSADRRFIVGRIEGNLHYLGSLGQNERQAELQAMFDRVKNADTLGSLVAMKQASPSGGSPVGNASNQDVQLVAKGANSLTQTGGVPKFDADLKKLRRDAYRTRQNAIEFYNDRYGELATEDPKFKLTVRPIADRYISSKDLSKPRTPVQPQTSTSKLSAKTRAKYGL